ncbi:MAG: hypothetical protein E7066_00280 [Lentimicrobiaceae bacterium]|nr:hypothetical protein [Lentimicrobiaceae bacterium]
MEQRNNEQNSVIFQIADIVNKMSSQVNFLIRKNLLMNQLDVDIMMENTRKLYNALCSVKCNMDVDSIPMEIENEEDLGIRNEELGMGNVKDDEEFIEDNYEEEPEENSDNDAEEEIEEIEEKIEEDFEEGTEDVIEEDSGIRTYIKTIEAEPQTLGDKLEQKEDNSLAARLQRKPVTDLMMAIGINDKFLLLNELFAGSMEKYNKSIRALNSFSTLFGARTYMSELQIELQWDCDSEAYKKLSDLVERRFL